jgi:hypothetical protein
MSFESEGKEKGKPSLELLLEGKGYFLGTISRTIFHDLLLSNRDILGIGMRAFTVGGGKGGMSPYMHVRLA